MVSIYGTAPFSTLSSCPSIFLDPPCLIPHLLIDWTPLLPSRIYESKIHELHKTETSTIKHTLAHVCSCPHVLLSCSSFGSAARSVITV